MYMVHLHIFILIQQYCRPVEKKQTDFEALIYFTNTRYNVLPLNHYASRLCILVRQRRVVQGTHSM